MTSFCARLTAAARDTGSLLCVGLDPHPADLPEPTAEAARAFCLRLIEATVGLAAAYKPNAAFFEVFGPAGWAALAEVIAAVPEGIPVILDAKRGDIASTAEAYARSAFEVLGADALTVNPYLGRDGLAPFLANPEHGAFVLCKTSNPGAGDLQDLTVDGGAATLYEHVASLARAWNEHDNLGLVAGATHPAALARVRAAAPDLWILAPGVGAQGGELKTALDAGLRTDGLGLLVPVSRSIARAADPRRAAQAIVDEMRETHPLPQAHPLPPPSPSEGEGARLSSTSDLSPLPPQRGRGWGRGARAHLADALLDAGCVRFGQFTLKSGAQSPVYLDLRQLVSHPALLSQVAQAYAGLLKDLTFDRLAALPYAALPIGTAISLQMGRPMIYPRKEVKAYGTAAEIEGEFRPGERVAVIDDLTTTGGSKFEAIAKLTAAGLVATDVVVLIDRQSGAREALAAAGYTLHAVLTLTELLNYWESTGRVPAEQIEATRGFLAQTR